MTTFREFWTRSAHFRQNGGWDECRGARVSFVWFHATFRQLRNGQCSRNLVTKRISVEHRGIRKDIFENFYYRGHFPAKWEIESRSNRHLTQSRLQVTGCTTERYCLLRAVVQEPGSFWDQSTFLYDVRLPSYGASNLPNFRIFAYFPYFLIPKAPCAKSPPRT